MESVKTREMSAGLTRPTCFKASSIIALRMDFLWSVERTELDTVMSGNSARQWFDWGIVEVCHGTSHRNLNGGFTLHALS